MPNIQMNNLFNLNRRRVLGKCTQNQQLEDLSNNSLCLMNKMDRKGLGLTKTKRIHFIIALLCGKKIAKTNTREKNY